MRFNYNYWLANNIINGGNMKSLIKYQCKSSEAAQQAGRRLIGVEHKVLGSALVVARTPSQTNFVTDVMMDFEAHTIETTDFDRSLFGRKFQ